MKHISGNIAAGSLVGPHLEWRRLYESRVEPDHVQVIIEIRSAVLRFAGPADPWSTLPPWTSPSQVAAILGGEEYVSAAVDLLRISLEFASPSSDGAQVGIRIDRHQQINVFGFCFRGDDGADQGDSPDPRQPAEILDAFDCSGNQILPGLGTLRRRNRLINNGDPFPPKKLCDILAQPLPRITVPPLSFTHFTIQDVEKSSESVTALTNSVAQTLL